MSPACFATSVPLPIAKPTSARLSAGASFMPSPVMPHTSPALWDTLASLLLSAGRARETTFSRGSNFASSLSDRSAISLLVSVTASGVSIPQESATALAVSALSPVTIQT